MLNENVQFHPIIRTRFRTEILSQQAGHTYILNDLERELTGNRSANSVYGSMDAAETMRVSMHVRDRPRDCRGMLGAR